MVVYKLEMKRKILMRNLAQVPLRIQDGVAPAEAESNLSAAKIEDELVDITDIVLTYNVREMEQWRTEEEECMEIESCILFSGMWCLTGSRHS